jgi:hypothetical protein
VAITESWSAVVIAMSGLKLQETFTPPVIVQLVYVVLPLTIFAFAVVAAALSVKATESMSLGVVAFSVYATAETVNPLIVPLPEPALEAGTVFVAVKAYARIASAAAATTTTGIRLFRTSAVMLVSDLVWVPLVRGQAPRDRFR